MPKEITHIHMAERMRDQADLPLADILNRRDRAYSWGSVAPDLFYYDLPFPLFGEKSQVSWGEIIHGRDGEDTMAHLVPLLDRARSLRDASGPAAEALFAFVSGYLTHVAVDTVFHPYIYSITGNYYAPEDQERKLAESRHRLFETCLDLHILRLRGETLVDFALQRRITLLPSEKDFLLDAFADALRTTHRPDVATEHVRQITRRAYRRARLLISLFQKVPIVRSLIVMNRTFSGRFGEIAHLGYGPHRALDRLDFNHLEDAPHPVTGTTLTGDLNRMIEDASRRGTSYLNIIHAYFLGHTGTAELRDILRPLSLNNGLERVPTKEMKFSRIDPSITAL